MAHRDMEFELKDVEIKNEDEIEIVDIKIENEEEGDNPFLGFDDADADTTVQILCQDENRCRPVSNTVPTIMDLVDSSLAETIQRNSINIKQELRPEYKDGFEPYANEQELSEYDKDSVSGESDVWPVKHRRVQTRARGDTDIRGPGQPKNSVRKATKRLHNKIKKTKCVDNNLKRDNLKLKYSKLNKRYEFRKNSRSIFENNQIHDYRIEGFKDVKLRSRLLTVFTEDLVKSLILTSSVNTVKMSPKKSVLKRRDPFIARTMRKSKLNKAVDYNDTLDAQEKSSDNRAISKVVYDLHSTQNISENTASFDQAMEDERAENAEKDYYDNGEVNQTGKQYVCDDCSFETTTHEEFKCHQNSHKETKPYACQFCEFRCVNEDYLKVHNRKHLREKPYKCSMCNFTCAYYGLIVGHKMKHHKVKSYKCSLCSFRTIHPTSVERHIGLCHERPLSLSCAHCDFKCSSRLALKNHMVVHSGRNYFTCTHCDYKHAKLGIIKRHMVVHSGDMLLKCPHCSYKAVQHEYVEKHIAKHHRCASDNNRQGKVRTSSSSDIRTSNPSDILGNKRLTICLTRCDSTNVAPSVTTSLIDRVNQRSLLEHCKTISGTIRIDRDFRDDDKDIAVSKKRNRKSTEKRCEEEIISCRAIVTADNHRIVSTVKKKICTKNVRSENLSQTQINDSIMLNEIVFKKLSKDVPEKVFHKCETCKYKTSDIDEFKAHCKKHTSRFSCDSCEFSCDSYNSLRRHELTKHSDAKPYECNLCGYKCSLAHNLKNHMVKHMTERNFPCDRCDYKAKTKRMLEAHVKRHDGIKPFACDLCDFRCATNTYLKVHRFIHTGETKFICSICDCKFRINAELKKHTKVHHTVDE